MIPRRRKHLLIAFGIATVAFDIALLVIDQHLEATGGPSILGLEFAGSRQRAAQIMGEWGSHGQYLARLSLWIDFGFMLSYGTFFTLAALATRDFARERDLRALAIAGIAAPFFAALAPLFDAAENIAWLLVLGGHGGSLAPPFATACASLKFLFIGLAIVYALWGLVGWLRYGKQPAAPNRADRALTAAEITVRRCQLDDVPGVLALWEQTRSEHASSTDRVEDVECLVGDSPAALLVAVHGGEIVGTLIAAWDGWRGNLYRLAVRDDRRRMGVGTALAGAGEDYLRSRGARRVTALVAFEDEVAGGFWDSAGYPQDREIGRRVRNI
ncbi:MAG TPA: GNAT family N-acetyltransferase [Solirubrobacterales bacterium]|jgi:ribosomal protein S18 acetylase RimI-like enzyme|nr:GNAT family N-acetyltransferase [Solirubrobacterales bacterium]